MEWSGEQKSPRARVRYSKVREQASWPAGEAASQLAKGRGPIDRLTDFEALMRTSLVRTCIQVAVGVHACADTHAPRTHTHVTRASRAGSWQRRVCESFMLSSLKWAAAGWAQGGNADERTGPHTACVGAYTRFPGEMLRTEYGYSFVSLAVDMRLTEYNGALIG